MKLKLFRVFVDLHDPKLIVRQCEIYVEAEILETVEFFIKNFIVKEVFESSEIDVEEY